MFSEFSQYTIDCPYCGLELEMRVESEHEGATLRTCHNDETEAGCGKLFAITHRMKRFADLGQSGFLRTSTARAIDGIGDKTVRRPELVSVEG